MQHIYEEYYSLLLESLKHRRSHYDSTKSFTMCKVSILDLVFVKYQEIATIKILSAKVIEKISLCFGEAKNINLLNGTMIIHDRVYKSTTLISKNIIHMYCNVGKALVNL